MKIRIALTSALATLLPLAAIAQNFASPAAPPNPPNPAAPAAASATAAVPAIPAVPAPPSRWREDSRETGPVTFLGVETSHVPRVLSEQLGLPRGFGVVVDYVVPDSAAAGAGLQQSDIIKMLNDQIIVDSDQLGVLVRSFADGASVNLKVLRKGQEVNLSAKLQQKKSTSSRGPVGYQWNFDDLEGMKNLHLPDMSAVRESVARARDQARAAVDRTRAELDRTRAEMDRTRAGMGKLHIVTTDDGAFKTSHIDLGKAQIVFSDDKGELRLETVNGHKTLTAKDATGKVLFSGPVETDVERAKIPPDVRERFENLEHEDLPPVPPNEPLAPPAPTASDSACLKRKTLEQAVLVSLPRTGWVRSTMLL